jgi:hypothetical protein
LEITEYGKEWRRSYILILEGRESCGWGRCISQLRRLVKHFAPAGITGQQRRLIQGQLRPVEDHRTFAKVVARQRVEKENESLTKGSMRRIVIQPGSVSNKIGKNERCVPGDHADRLWFETLKFAEEGAFTAQALQNLLLSLRKDVDRCMEHLGLGQFAFDLEPKEGTKNYGPFGVKGKGPCGDVSVSQSKLGQDELAHRQKPGFSGLVYQCCNPQSKAFWRVKQGMNNTGAGTSRSLEKAMVHSIVGAETIVPVPKGALRDGGREQNVLLLVRRSPEELVVGKNGSDSECSAVASRQFGFGLDEVDEATGMFGFGSVVEEGPAQEMLKAGGGLPQATQLSRCSSLIAVTESSWSGSEFVDQRLAEENLDVGGVPELKLVNSSSVEVKVGGNIEEVISVGKQVESFFWESGGGRMEIGSTSKGEVGEEGVLYQYSLDIQEYLPKDLLLQYEDDIRGIWRGVNRCYSHFW